VAVVECAFTLFLFLSNSHITVCVRSLELSPAPTATSAPLCGACFFSTGSTGYAVQADWGGSASAWNGHRYERPNCDNAFWWSRPNLWAAWTRPWWVWWTGSCPRLRDHASAADGWLPHAATAAAPRRRRVCRSTNDARLLRARGPTAAHLPFPGLPTRRPTLWR